MASQVAQIVDSLPASRKRRARKVRPAKFPLNIERQYVAEHKGLIQDLGAIIGELLLPRLEEIATLGGFRADASRFDQSLWRSVLQAIFGEMRSKWEFAAGQAERLAEDTANEISDFNRRQIGKQLRAAVGVDVFFQDTELQDTMEQFASDNVSRIVTYPATIFPKLERIVSNGYRAGLRANAIRDQIVNELGVEESRAAFWARDQIGSLNGQLTKQRQESIGIDEYIWRSSLDERVRATHRRLEGTKHRWDDPPQVGARLVHPGEDYNCRCTADPVIPGIENIETSPSDVPRDPELVKRLRARARKRRERAKEKRLTGEPADVIQIEKATKKPAKTKRLKAPEPIVPSPVAVAVPKPKPKPKPKRKPKPAQKAEPKPKPKPVVKPTDKPVPVSYSKDVTIEGATFDSKKFSKLLRDASKPGVKVTKEQAVEIRRQLNAIALKYGMVNHAVLRGETGRTKFEAVAMTGKTAGTYVGGKISIDKEDLRAASRILSGKGTFRDIRGAVTVFHENMHCHSPTTAKAYSGPIGIGIEEATTELAAVKMVQDVTGRPAKVSAYRGYIRAMERGFSSALESASKDYDFDPSNYTRLDQLNRIMTDASINMRRRAYESEGPDDLLEDFADSVEWPNELFKGRSEADAASLRLSLKTNLMFKLAARFKNATPN